MSTLDWVVLVLTLLAIVSYGVWKSIGTRNIDGFLLADKQLPWYHVGLSVMATQASAITFISAPGQAYSDGLRFVQLYFGLPLATVVLCVSFIPIFRKLNVFTAYEYLEKRFDMRTRVFTAFLFLLQRGLSTGLTIYAPAIIVSTILDMHITYTTLLVGALVISYTVYGGAKAVSYTQLFQMGVIFSGLFAAAFMVVHLLPSNVGFFDALHIAGKMGKLNAIDTHLDWNNRYNIWSGLIGGFFLQLSYLGTDQSQVGRFLTGKSTDESKMGLIMNGLIKIPMQFLILLIGTLVFTFYQFHAPPLFFNKAEVSKIENSPHAAAYQILEKEYKEAQLDKRLKVEGLVEALSDKKEEEIDKARVELQEADKRAESYRKQAVTIIKQNDPTADVNDNNYVFLSFVTQYFPKGLVGLLVAIIFLAAMGSTASALNSLASTSVVDFYKRMIQPDASEETYLAASRWSTLGWGVFCVVVALYAGKMGNLIEAVNMLGSLFYGTILGIFLVAFYLKEVGGRAVFYGALLAELLVAIAWHYEIMAYLWLNVIGCLLVLGFSYAIQKSKSTFRMS